MSIANGAARTTHRKIRRSEHRITDQARTPCQESWSAEPVGTQVDKEAKSTSRSAISSPENSTNTLADSARDVLALAVALGDRRAIVLTPLGAGRAAPTLVDHLAAAGIACRELTERVLMEPLRNTLVPALLASGLAVPLASDRFRLAALSVVAPGALGAAALATDIISGGDDDLSLEAAADQGEAVLWDDAAAIWWELP